MTERWTLQRVWEGAVTLGRKWQRMGTEFLIFVLHHDLQEEEEIQDEIDEKRGFSGKEGKVWSEAELEIFETGPKRNGDKGEMVRDLDAASFVEERLVDEEGEDECMLDDFQDPSPNFFDEDLDNYGEKMGEGFIDHDTEDDNEDVLDGMGCLLRLNSGEKSSGDQVSNNNSTFSFDNEFLSDTIMVNSFKGISLFVVFPITKQNTNGSGTNLCEWEKAGVVLR